jgi:uncharacterized DUF497 family protein
MNTQHALHGITFEWDSQKAVVNLRKHKVAFRLACEAFFDPFVCYLDEEIVGSELRERIVGSTTTRVMLYIVYVMRDNVIRIVSARPATNAERRIYENQ